ncbi:MAG: hypothetical protein R3336_08090, partial [Phycisphaeraceae bacterium]|nr:hypothetical protein [Phycisphaeraceae bacterium]
RSVVAVGWTDEDGDRHREQGEGHFIAKLPDKLAVTVGKLGHTGAWAGTDGRRYWLFDLREDDEVILYVGDRQREPDPRVRPMFVRPDHLPALLGLASLGEQPPAVRDGMPTVDFAAGRILVLSQDRSIRMALEPKTGRPRRVELLDERGRVLVTAKLSKYRLLEQEGKSPGVWPWVPGRIELASTDKDRTMSLNLNGLVDEPDRIQDRVFDLSILARKFEPARVIRVDRREAPADEAPSD